MARGTQLKECKYEIDTFVGANKVRTVLNACFIKMDKFNIGTTDTKIKESTSAITPIPFNVSVRKNKKVIGIHPRHLILRWNGGTSSNKCDLASISRTVIMPVLTLAQFNILKEYEFEVGGDQPNTIITVNHSSDGSAYLEYRIVHKVDQFML
jgi:hypothetical protein